MNSQFDNSQFPMSGSKSDSARTNGDARTQRKNKYDIYERTFQFAVGVVKFVRTFPRTVEGRSIGGQLIRAGTGVGSNMEEADGASSRRDFEYRIEIAAREAWESRFWLRLSIAVELGDQAQARALHKEADELVRILTSIITNSKMAQNEAACSPSRSKTIGDGSDPGELGIGN